MNKLNIADILNINTAPAPIVDESPAVDLSRITTTSIASSAVLLDFSMSSWSATKNDKDADATVEAAAKTTGKVGKYIKDLMADNKKLKAVKSHIAATRMWLLKNAIPWNFNGQVIVPMAMYMMIIAGIKERETAFWQLVEDFVAEYETGIAASAFSLGTLFKREDYPSKDAVRAKFAFRYMESPMPQAGHFVVDLERTMKDELIEHFNKVSEERVNAAVTSIWQRLYKTLRGMIAKLTDERGDDGDLKKKRFHDTFLTNAEELVELLRACNLTKDQRLTDAANELDRVLMGIDLIDLKKLPEARAAARNKIEAVLNKFDNGTAADMDDDADWT